MLSLPWLLTSAATAATWTVPTDFSTIGAAASAAASGDVIRILPGTWVERVRVTRSLTFEGDPGTVWVSTFGEYEALEVESATVTVRGIQFGMRGRSRGIDVLSGATVVVEDCVFADGVSEDGGGIRARYGTSLTVRNSTFLNGHANDEGGGIFSEGMGSLLVADSAFIDATADDGAALAVHDTTPVTLERLWLEHNEVLADGGALLAHDSDVTLTASMLCDNRAGDDGAGIDLESANLVAVGNAFLLGRSTNAGAAIDADGYSTVTTTNNAFLGHDASEAGGTIDASSHTSVNDLVAFNGAGIRAHDASGASLAHVAFWSNDNADTNAVLPASAVLADPQIVGWPPTSCGSDLFLDATSPLIDAGDPAIVDLDGSPSDIGPLSGPTPLAAERPAQDVDGDGASADIDCNDRDPTTHPSAVEICDGRDNDCDGAIPADEVDSDGDGYLLCGDDCDDSRSSVRPGATEVPADGVDQDCDGDELCYDDADGDGFGTADLIDSSDLDCTDAGEAANPDDVCPTASDLDDRDADGTPDGCDACPDDATGDSDGDGVCDSDDVCPNYNDNDDTDGDGIPNGCDACQSLYDADTDGVPDDCDLCPGADDNTDTDADGVADGCDPCPLDVDDDSDADGVCDVDDVCPGGDDTVDSDGDGVPDDCDSTPIDTGTEPTEPTEPTDTGTPPDPGPVDTATPDEIDSDGDGIPDPIDPDPSSAGGDGAAAAPQPAYGCGCDHGTRFGASWALLLLTLVRRR